MPSSSLRVALTCPDWLQWFFGYDAGWKLCHFMASFPAKAGGSWQGVLDSWPWGYPPAGDSRSKEILTYTLGLVVRSITSLKTRFWADLWSIANAVLSKKKKGIEFISSCQAIDEVKHCNHFLGYAKSSAIPA